jgi:hypothetical protein
MVVTMFSQGNIQMCFINNLFLRDMYCIGRNLLDIFFFHFKMILSSKSNLIKTELLSI